MQTDKMGRPDTSLNYGNREFIAVEWDDTTTADTVYLRGDYADACVIQRIKDNKIEWSYGNWADRASLAYGHDRLFNRG